MHNSKNVLKKLSFAVLTAVCLLYPSVVLPQTVIFQEDFESASEFGLPAGWSEYNETWVDDGSSLAKQDEFLGWTVVTADTLASLGGNRVNNPSVFSGKSIYAESDLRSDYQIQWLYTPVIDMSAYAKAIFIEFDSNYIQNQDNICYAEYSLDGQSAIDNPDGAEWLPIFYWINSAEVNLDDVAGIFETNGINDNDLLYIYSDYVGARPLADLGPFIEGRGDDDANTNKKHENRPLFDASGESQVVIRFFQGGGASWFWGIDNFKVIEKESYAPNKPTLTAKAETTGSSSVVTPGEAVILTGSAFNDNDTSGAASTHASSTWQVSSSADFQNIIFSSENDTSNLISITVPADVFPKGSTAFARVQYTDGTNVASQFSDTMSFVIIDPNPVFPEGIYFMENFTGQNTQSLNLTGWDIGQNEFAKEVGTEFIIAPAWPIRPPSGDFGYLNPPKVDGTQTDGGYLMSDSDAADGSDNVGSKSMFYAVTPSFSTLGSTEVWWHANVEIETNNNGECVAELSVSTDGGNTWTPEWQMVEPQRFEKADGSYTNGFPEFGTGSHRKTWDGLHGRWHLKLESAANKPDVRVRFMWYEPADAWWMALDDFLVDSIPPPQGSVTVLSEDFENGIPSTWKNTPKAKQVWGTEPLKNDSGAYIRCVDIILKAAAEGTTVNPAGGAFDGRGMNMLCGQGYALWQDDGNAATAEAGTLDTPVLDFSDASRVYIDFDSEYLAGNSGQRHFAEVFVSYDGGQTFPTRLFTYQEALMNVEEGAYFDHHYLEAPGAAGKSAVVFRFSGNSSDAPGSANGFWAIDNVHVTADTGPAVVEPMALPFKEDFEGLPLGPNVDEAVAGTNVWTKTAPAGWTIDDSGVPGQDDPTQGVTEWTGWSFADVTWWATAAGDQRRTEFTNASGAVAVADPDEWDDKGDPESLGTYNTFLSTPPISLDGVAANTVYLTFDSSWRPETNQTASVTVSYDGGVPVQVMLWTSPSGDATYHDHAPNEKVAVALNNPAGANQMVVNFGLTNAVNNWWWAIDNVVIDSKIPPVAMPFSEDFEGLPLGPNVDETVAGTAVWTKTAPAGWTIDDSGVPGQDDPTQGVTEWTGWSFADVTWWATAAGDQRRTEFTNASGAVAVADPDEWDDKGDPESLGTYNTFLSTPPITVTGVEANTVVLTFDSSWRPETNQTASVTVSYDGGAPVQVMLWTSPSGDATYHDHAPNENVTVSLNNPAGASQMVVTFGLTNAINNWWWAIDNVTIDVGTAVNNWSIY